MNNNLNIAPVISPNITTTISKAKKIVAFGGQLVDKAKESSILGDQTKIAELNIELVKLTAEGIQAGVDKNKEIQKATQNYNSGQITQEQYNSIEISIDASYRAKMADIEIKKQKINQDIDNILNNPDNKIKKDQNDLKNKIKKQTTTIKNKKSKANKDLRKQVISNAVKTLAPIITLQLTNSLISVVSQRKKLEILVDQVNEYIDTQVKDQATVTIATNLRNNALTLINNSIKKLQAIEKILKTITRIITIFALVLKVLSFIPTPLPPKAVLVLIKAGNLVSALSALLITITVLISNEIEELIELRNRLKQISLKLDGKTLENLDESQIAELSNTFLPVGINTFAPYKGFTFKIKEEQDIRFVVKGNKRRYAVAIDRYGVEILKSEYSFTLDPQDLVEQLKLVIDQQNLQG